MATMRRSTPPSSRPDRKRQQQVDEQGADQHLAERANCEDEAVVGEGERLQEAAEADRDHQRADVACGTSSPGVEPCSRESPADPERERRIGAPVDVVPAVEDDQERADPHQEGERRLGRSARGRGCSSQQGGEAVPVSSPLGMKPRAPAGTDRLAEIGRVMAGGEHDLRRLAVPLRARRLGDLEPVDVGQPYVEQDQIGAQLAGRRRAAAPSSASPTTS